MSDAEVSGAQFATYFFDLQLNCNQKWIRKEFEADAPLLELSLYQGFIDCKVKSNQSLYKSSIIKSYQLIKISWIVDHTNELARTQSNILEE